MYIHVYVYMQCRQSSGCFLFKVSSLLQTSLPLRWQHHSTRTVPGRVTSAVLTQIRVAQALLPLSSRGSCDFTIPASCASQWQPEPRPLWLTHTCFRLQEHEGNCCVHRMCMLGSYLAVRLSCISQPHYSFTSDYGYVHFCTCCKSL